MLKLGICSVTFRRLPAEEVIRLTTENGLDGIEWGGDIHVPCGAYDTARHVRQLTLHAGLEVISYGSYCRCETLSMLEPLTATAKALGAPIIRVWAGDKGSCKTSTEERAAIIHFLCRLCDQAPELKIGVEYHQNTLTDTAISAKRICEEVGRDNFFTYFQMQNRTGFREELELLEPFVDNVHVFAPGHHELAAAQPEWESLMELLKRRPRALLMEFVQNDSPEQFHADAAVLKQISRYTGA